MQNDPDFEKWAHVISSVVYRGLLLKMSTVSQREANVLVIVLEVGLCVNSSKYSYSSNKT